MEDVQEINILVVDDDPSIGRLMAEFLLMEGYSPIICGHPQEALEFSKNGDFSLAFVDINMPEMDGLQLATRLKDHQPLCEIVFITGHGSFDNAVQAIKIGAYDYLRKPFGISELRLCLRRFQERNELKDKIRFAEQRYFHLVQNIPSLVFVINRDFQLEFVNRACESMLGFRPEEAMKTPNWLLDRYHQDDLQHMKGLFLNAFQSRNSRFSAECRLVHRDGHSLYAMVGAIALAETKGSGRIDRLQGMIVDITDRVFLEKAVVQKEKLKLLGSISAEVAHGIRNPLVSIGGFARRLRKRFQELPEGDIILKESERLEKMLQRIAEYLRPVEVDYKECSINNLVTDCVSQLSREMDEKGIRCSLKLEPGLSIISADREILAQVFVGLIRNAEREMDRLSELNIRTYESANNLHIEFKNMCENAKAGDPESFFLPFNSGEHEVGLPLYYRLLKKMGGLLSYSHGENDMAFTVSLPKKPIPVSEIDGVLKLG